MMGSVGGFAERKPAGKEKIGELPKNKYRYRGGCSHAVGAG
jgi:hypothetical protein